MEIPKTAKQIPNSKDWVDVDGAIYSIDTHFRHKNQVFKKKQHKVWDYLYCGIYDNNLGKTVSRRVHRIVAEAFIPNPKKLPIVGHKNNIKDDNRIENLYWTTESENTQKAVDDGLLVNDKGFDDSQSIPVNMYCTYTGELIKTFGSVSIAAKYMKIRKNSIVYSAKEKPPARKPYYFRFLDDKEQNYNHNIIGMFDYDTDNLIDVFINKSDAAKKTKYNEKMIGTQCRNGKPKHKFNNYYFKEIPQSSNYSYKTIKYE